MKATYAVITDRGKLSIETEEINLERLAPYELAVEAEATVVSAGTELANFLALSPGVWKPGSWNAYPWRPGYGLIGHVTAVGSELSGFTIGQRIFCFGKHASLQRYNASADTPFSAAFSVDESLPFSDALMARMALISLTAPQMTEFEAGDTVAVFGLGLVGNFAAQLYQLAGARVIGLDIVNARCEMAREVGIETVLYLPAENQVEALRELTDGNGVSVAVDAVGHAAVIQNCVEVCDRFGQVILLGSPRVPYEANVTQMLRAIHHRWIRMIGALEWRLPPFPVHGFRYSIASNLQMLLDHIRQGFLKVDPLITHVIQPTELLAAYEGLAGNKEVYQGVVIDWRDN